MRTKILLVSLVTLAITLALLSAVTAQIADNVNVKVNDLWVYVEGTGPVGSNVSVRAGETISVKVTFTANESADKVRVKAEIEGDRDVDAETSEFSVEAETRYSKTLKLTVPFELKDELSDKLELNIEIESDSDAADWDNGGAEVATLRVQRETFEASIKSIETPQSVEAGQTLPVDVVLKSTGYNDLDDVYVTASIPALGVKRTAYFGDLVALECTDDDDTAEENYGVALPFDRSCDEDDIDTVSGRIYLELPDEAAEGVYTIEVKASNDDTESSATAQVIVRAIGSSDVIATVTGRTVAAGENAVYSVLIINPTSKLAVYRIVPEASSDLSVSASETVVAVPAGSSKTVEVTAKSDVEGAYNFNVSVFSGEELVKAVALSANVEGKKTVASPVTVLTVVLAIIFVVLLIVLFVLVGKKPEKAEEFGESYY